MPRSNWKSQILWNKFQEKNKRFKIFNPHFKIKYDFIGKIFFVYDGRKFKKIIINDSMVGFYLSEFITTRFNNGSIHDKDKKKQRIKNK